ncbi:MAG TPA: DUF5947 family protein [Nocardioidaceae bacterium]|nr:DUF5947 family protein [Nocardioidaceae bacterium]
MTQSLRRLAAPKPPPEPQVERCEFCAVAIGDRHGHVADTNDHRLMCVCRPCYLLFAPQGAGGGRYRGVGEEVRIVEDLSLNEVQWDALRIPVDLAFFFRQTGAEDLLAFYPGPGGATESLLDLAAWAEIAAENPVLDAIETDVEAVLLRKRHDGFTCHLVPIDLCYELVGVVRMYWTGLGGGTEVWHAIDEFFSNLDERGEAVPRAGAA